MLPPGGRTWQLIYPKMIISWEMKDTRNPPILRIKRLVSWHGGGRIIEIVVYT
jgi:hypothetical protein